MADVADGRPRPDVRPGPSLHQIQSGQGAIRRGALSERGAPALWRARPAARRSRIRGRRLFGRGYCYLAVGVALRVADRRSQQVPERETLVHGHRQAPGDAEGLQGSEGRRRGADPGVTLCRENESPRSTPAPAAPSPRGGEGGGEGALTERPYPLTPPSPPWGEGEGSGRARPLSTSGGHHHHANKSLHKGNV